jgi:hypothetical protein
VASYDQWNSAITQYVTSGIPRGSPVYLSIDGAVLKEIGEMFSLPTTYGDEWPDDFVESVRSHCVVDGAVNLGAMNAFDSGGLPRSVGFLALMVLSAYHMMEEETEGTVISEINYFTRLNRLLGFAVERGRPPGLAPAGVEEHLWLHWNSWLVRNDWLPSARKGDAIANRYVAYPLSQSLLREADRERLERMYRKGSRDLELRRDWDRDQVFRWLCISAGQMGSAHLRGLFAEADLRRREALADAAFDVYTAVDWQDEGSQDHGFRQRRLVGGLYRMEDPVADTIDYLLYVREPRRARGLQLTVAKGSEACYLVEDRRGWFVPLWAESPDGGVRYPVSGDPQFKEVFLPSRAFWVLVQDPDSPESGVYATWGTPALGETFLLLCRAELAGQMAILEDEGLISWRAAPPLRGHPGWVEYRDCMVLSPNWGDLVAAEPDLVESLRPRTTASVSLAGGLNVSCQGGWLQGHCPEVKIFTFEDVVNLRITGVGSEVPLFEEEVESSGPARMPGLDPGHYLLQVYARGKPITQRILRVIAWESLQYNLPAKRYSLGLGNWYVEGAMLKRKSKEVSR